MLLIQDFSRCPRRLTHPINGYGEKGKVSDKRHTQWDYEEDDQRHTFRNPAEFSVSISRTKDAIQEEEIQTVTRYNDYQWKTPGDGGIVKKSPGFCSTVGKNERRQESPTNIEGQNTGPGERCQESVVNDCSQVETERTFEADETERKLTDKERTR